MPKPPGTAVHLRVPDDVQAGQTFTATATVTVPADAPNATGLTASLNLPDGWTAGGQPGVGERGTSRRLGRVHLAGPGGLQPAGSGLGCHRGCPLRAARPPGEHSDERIIRSVPPPPPAGTDAVSDLPFLSATNGWGPVERDTSNGEQAAGDGHPITINGVTYANGLGTNATSDVEVYLGGHCTRFTAMVGVDDEHRPRPASTVTADGPGRPQPQGSGLADVPPPPAAQPPAAQPPATGPSATGPSATGPSATGPSATGPQSAPPSTGQPSPRQSQPPASSPEPQASAPVPRSQPPATPQRPAPAFTHAPGSAGAPAAPAEPRGPVTVDVLR